MNNQERAHYNDEVLSVVKKHEPQLSNLLRYARFIEIETPQEWTILLGPDVVGLTHPEVTLEISERFINYNAENGIKLSQDEQVLFLMAAKVHDWGEFIIEDRGVGDVTFEQKTQSHENEELYIFNLLLVDIEDTGVRDFLGEAYTEVVLDRSTKLGRMFNAVERVGYLETAIRAFVGINNKRIANWRGLVGNVLSNQIVTLLEYRKEYPYVDTILKESDSVIDEMFSNVLLNQVPLDNAGNNSYDLSKLGNAQKAWLLR